MLNLNALNPAAYIPGRYATIADTDRWFEPYEVGIGGGPQWLATLHEQFRLSGVVKSYLHQSGRGLPQDPENHSIYILKDRYGNFIGAMLHDGVIYVGVVTYEARVGGRGVWCGQSVLDMKPR